MTLESPPGWRPLQRGVRRQVSEHRAAYDGGDHPTTASASKQDCEVLAAVRTPGNGNIHQSRLAAIEEDRPADVNGRFGSAWRATRLRRDAASRDIGYKV